MSHHSRSASVPLLKIPNAYEMTLSCPTSPSHFPMISRRSSLPGDPDEDMFNFNYFPEDNYIQRSRHSNLKLISSDVANLTLPFTSLTNAIDNRPSPSEAYSTVWSAARSPTELRVVASAQVQVIAQLDLPSTSDLPILL